MKEKLKALVVRMRTNFITGILTFLPLVITGYLVSIIVSKINAFIITITPKVLEPFVLENSYALWVKLFIFAIVLGIISFLGFITKLYIGKEFLRFGDILITKIPILNKIYSGITQISKAFFGQKENIFKKVVLIQYPRNGIYSIGFLTGKAKGEIQVKTEQNMQNIFVPTTPNPTSGMLIMIPEEEIIYLDMTVEEGMKLIISGGAVAPEYGRES